MPQEYRDAMSDDELTKSLVQQFMGESFVPVSEEDGTFTYQLARSTLTVKRTGPILHLQVGSKDEFTFDVVKDGNLEQCWTWLVEVQLAHDADKNFERIVNRLVKRQKERGANLKDAYMRRLRGERN